MIPQAYFDLQNKLRTPWYRRWWTALAALVA